MRKKPRHCRTTDGPGNKCFRHDYGGMVTSGGGSFVKLSPGFTDSNPDNTVGNNTFDNLNLYGFDEDQNTTVMTNPLNVDILASTGISGSLTVGTVVASHYIFFDPLGSANQEGWVEFDSNILAIIGSTTNLANSDYLANTGVTYLNPGALTLLALGLFGPGLNRRHRDPAIGA